MPWRLPCGQDACQAGVGGQGLGLPLSASRCPSCSPGGPGSHRFGPHLERQVVLPGRLDPGLRGSGQHESAVSVTAHCASGPGAWWPGSGHHEGPMAPWWAGGGLGCPRLCLKGGAPVARPWQGRAARCFLGVSTRRLKDRQPEGWAQPPRLRAPWWSRPSWTCCCEIRVKHLRASHCLLPSGCQERPPRGQGPCLAVGLAFWGAGWAGHVGFWRPELGGEGSRDLSQDLSAHPAAALWEQSWEQRAGGGVRVSLAGTAPSPLL